MPLSSVRFANHTKSRSAFRYRTRQDGCDVRAKMDGKRASTRVDQGLGHFYFDFNIHIEVEICRFQ